MVRAPPRLQTVPLLIGEIKKILLGQAFATKCICLRGHFRREECQVRIQGGPGVRGLGPP